MGTGEKWEDKIYKYKDDISGREITRLTNYKGHSNNLYFTDQFWIRDNESFIFTSDRAGYSNLFKYDLNNYEIIQLTDLKGEDRPKGFYSKVNSAHYFWYDGVLHELSMQNLNLKTLYEPPSGFRNGSSVSITSDGKYACFNIQEKIKEKVTGLNYAKSPQYYKRYQEKPRAKIIKLEIESKKAEVVHEENYYIQHVNTNPKYPHLLNFSHEGPWADIDQRIWGLNLNTGKVWKIRPQSGDAAIGHEYWFEDGERIGYHGRRLPDEKEHFFGTIKWDNTGQIEYDFPFHCTHFSGSNKEYAIGDGRPANVQPWFHSEGKPYIILLKWEKDHYVGPRILAYHRSTFNFTHPHATFTPDKNHILYSSDVTGYSQLYLVKVGDFYNLPKLDNYLNENIE